MVKQDIRVLVDSAISMPIKGWFQGDSFGVGLTRLQERMTSIGVAFSRFRRCSCEYDEPKEDRPDQASIWPAQLSAVQRGDALQKNRGLNEKMGPFRIRMVLSERLRHHPARWIYRSKRRHMGEAQSEGGSGEPQQLPLIALQQEGQMRSAFPTLAMEVDTYWSIGLPDGWAIWSSVSTMSGVWRAMNREGDVAGPHRLDAGSAWADAHALAETDGK